MNCWYGTYRERTAFDDVSEALSEQGLSHLSWVRLSQAPEGGLQRCQRRSSFGSGTNLQAIIDAVMLAKLDATIELVVFFSPRCIRSEEGGRGSRSADSDALKRNLRGYIADMVICELKRYNVDYVVGWLHA